MAISTICYAAHQIIDVVRNTLERPSGESFVHLTERESFGLQPNMTLLMFGSLVEEFRLTRARQVLVFRDSTDRSLLQVWRSEGEGSGLSRRGSTELGHNICLAWWQLSQARLWNTPTPSYINARGEMRRRLIQEEAKTEEVEIRLSRKMGKGKQLAWTHWEHITGRNIRWTELEMRSSPMCPQSLLTC